MKSLLRPWSVLIGGVALLALLAGCAAPVTSVTGSSPGSPTATATTVSGSGEVHGCPAQNPPASAGTKADVVVSFKGGGQGEQVTLNKGQTLEVRLPAAIRWSLKTQGDAHVLLASTGNGWYDASLNSCIWRFAAANQGNETLAFGGTMACKPDTQCPALAVAQEYDITVR